MHSSTHSRLGRLTGLLPEPLASPVLTGQLCVVGGLMASQGLVEFQQFNRAG